MTKNPYVRVVTVVLLLEALAFYAFASRAETVPPGRCSTSQHERSAKSS